MAFFDNIKFPFFTTQELNLDWLLNELKRIAGFMPQDGNVGDVLTRKSDGAEWEPPDAVNINIDNLPEDTAITDNDQLVFYDISAQANRKIKPPNLLDSMMSNGTPLMDGTASAGTSKKPARYDHKHPTDTSRQAALSGAQMNAVNSGAPASSFSSGKLKIENGGTGADTVSTARENLGISYSVGTHNFEYAAVFGFVTNTSKDVTINVQTPLLLIDHTTITVTSMVGSLRTVQGTYVNGASNYDFTSEISNVRIRNGGLTITLHNENGYGITNNTPICGELSSFSFTSA